MVALWNRADHYLWSPYVIGQTIYIFILFLYGRQWRNWGFRRPGAEAVKCAPLESRHVSLTPTVHLLVKYTTVVVPSQQLPCSSVIFL